MSLAFSKLSHLSSDVAWFIVRLVLELTELYLAAEKNDHRSPQRQRPNPKAATKKVTGAGKFQDPLPRVPRVVAPFLFFPALQSLAQVRPFDFARASHVSCLFLIIGLPFLLLLSCVFVSSSCSWATLKACSVC